MMSKEKSIILNKIKEYAEKHFVIRTDWLIKYIHIRNTGLYRKLVPLLYFFNEN